MFWRRFIWITLIVAGLVGLAVTALWWYQSEERAIRAIAGLGGKATRYHGGPVAWVDLTKADADAAIKYIHAFDHLDVLNLSGSNVTDAGVAEISGHPSLGFLQLSDTGVTDAGLLLLARLPRLYRIDLDGTMITDAGLSRLEYLDCLSVLILDNTAITDAAFEQLIIPCLALLSVQDTGITEVAARAFERRLRSSIGVSTGAAPLSDNRTTVSPAELFAVLQSTQENSFPGTLVLEGSDDAFQHYRIETIQETLGRYRVPVEPSIADSEWSERLGEICEVEGRAVNAKVGAYLDGPDIYVDLVGYWPDSAHDRRVIVTGLVVDSFDLPVFISWPGAPQRSGIPVPIGTDLHSASRRFLLTGVRWQLRGES